MLSLDGAADEGAQLVDAVAFLGGGDHHGHALRQVEGLLDGRALLLLLLLRQLVGLGQHDGEGQLGILQEAHHVAIERRGVVADVDERYHQGEVLPGVDDTFARPLRYISLLSSDDLPTFERPAKDTSGPVEGGS